MRFRRHPLFVISAGSTLLILLSANTALAQARETKSQRLEQLRSVLTREDQAIDLLSAERAGQGREHTQELADVKKARNAVQRLINEIEGRDVNAGVEKDQKRDAQSAKNRQAPADYYASLLQVRQDLDKDHEVLSHDPGEKNAHRNNAMKFIEQARQPIVKELEEYARTHPAAAAPQPPADNAQAAAAQYPADKRGQELHSILSHEDHSIDILNSQTAADSQHQKALSDVTKVRDTVQQLIDSVEHRDVTKDLAGDRARDAAKRKETIPDYYTGLTTVQQYLKNDHITLYRHPDDPGHLRTTALQSIEQAQASVQQEIDAYVRAHPNVKR